MARPPIIDGRSYVACLIAWLEIFVKQDLHMFDCLRANKATSAFGLEARTPFLDRSFLDQVTATNPACRLQFATAVYRAQYIGHSGPTRGAIVAASPNCHSRCTVASCHSVALCGSGWCSEGSESIGSPQVMMIDPKHKMCFERVDDKDKGSIEKYILRKAFDTPDEVTCPPQTTNEHRRSALIREQNAFAMCD